MEGPRWALPTGAMKVQIFPPPTRAMANSRVVLTNADEVKAWMRLPDAISGLPIWSITLNSGCVLCKRLGESSTSITNLEVTG